MLEPDKRRELEEYWRQRVKDARAVYICASAHHTRIVEELGHGHIAQADGSFAVAQARRAEAWARHELARTMKVYTDLVITGKVPVPDGEEKLLF